MDFTGEKLLVMDASTAHNFFVAGHLHALQDVTEALGLRVVVCHVVDVELRRAHRSAPAVSRAYYAARNTGYITKLEKVNKHQGSRRIYEAVQRIRAASGAPSTTRLDQNLGEQVTVAQAADLRNYDNIDVTVAIDDGYGKWLANDHGLDLLTTPSLLRVARDLGGVTQARAIKVYRDMIRSGRHLPDIRHTGLLRPGPPSPAREEVAAGDRRHHTPVAAGRNQSAKSSNETLPTVLGWQRTRKSSPRAGQASTPARRHSSR